MVDRWPAMLVGPDGRREVFKRLADVPPGWRSDTAETQAEIEALHGGKAEPEPERPQVSASTQNAVHQLVGPNGETWGGRGRKPRWLIEAEAARGDGA